MPLIGFQMDRKSFSFFTTKTTTKKKKPPTKLLLDKSLVANGPNKRGSRKLWNELKQYTYDIDLLSTPFACIALFVITIVI